MKRIAGMMMLLCVALQLMAQEGALKVQLETLKGVEKIEELSSDIYAEKYVVYMSQALNHKDTSAGTFEQRVVVNHVGFDRPTVIVTEGYGAAYALRDNYQDELSRLFNTNVVVVEHRYFLESMPKPCNWDYLTAENSAYDLHHVNQTLRKIYPGKWISTGISKGGQTTMIYRSYFPDDVDISVPYVGPLCKGVEDGRHEPFLRKVGKTMERGRMQQFQIEVLKRKADIVPLLEDYCKTKKLTFNVPLAEVLDYCVLEYPFAMWQWGTSVKEIPAKLSETKVLFDHLMEKSGPDYFAREQTLHSFFVQAARELGYYGYDVKPFKKWLTIDTAQGYLAKLMLPDGVDISFSDATYHKVLNFLRHNDPKMIFIYGEIDPWTAARVPDMKGKENMQIFVQPRGSHKTRISTMPEDMRETVIDQIEDWLEE